MAVRVAAVALLLLLVPGCRQEAPSVRGPIVLVTVGGLRSDMIDARTTPRLTRLGREVTWAGRAVTASSLPLTSLASLLSGLRPWHHQMLGFEHTGQRPLRTLAGRLEDAGRKTRAVLPKAFYGAAADFGTVSELTEAETWSTQLSGLTDGELVWVHLPGPEMARGRHWRGTRGASPMSRQQLLAYADPDLALGAADRAALVAVYRRELHRVDRRIGDLLDALARSPAWPRTTLVVTASHGLELGEHGQILYGENLGRTVIEVPLFLRPGAGVAPLAVAPGTRVSQLRIFPTLAAAAGVAADPVHLPSLFQADAGEILSELYAVNGANHFSLLVDDLQLRWTSRFAPAEREYYLARRWRAGARGLRLKEKAPVLFRRLAQSFDEALPLSGAAASEVRLELVRWGRRLEPVADPELEREMARRLEHRFLRFVDRERPPAEERSLGVVPYL